MSYTNVVFKQNITRNVNRDQIERQRIDDRGISDFMKLAFNRGSKLQAISSSNQKKILHSTLTVTITIIKSRKGSIKTMTQTIASKEKTIGTKQIDSTTPDSANVWRESIIGGRIKSEKRRRKKSSGSTIKKFSPKTKETRMVSAITPSPKYTNNQKGGRNCKNSMKRRM